MIIQSVDSLQYPLIIEGIVSCRNVHNNNLDCGQCGYICVELPKRYLFVDRYVHKVDILE